MSLETSSLLSNAFGTSGFSWDSAKPRALSCRTPCQHTSDYRCAMSPTNPETMTKGVMFLLQSSQVKGRDLDPVSQIPSFLGNHWLLVPGTSGSPQHCSHFDSFMPHHPVTSSVLDSGDRWTTSWKLSQHAVLTGMGPKPNSQEEGLQKPAGGTQSGAPVSRRFQLL